MDETDRALKPINGQTQNPPYANGGKCTSTHHSI